MQSELVKIVFSVFVTGLVSYLAARWSEERKHKQALDIETVKHGLALEQARNNAEQRLHEAKEAHAKKVEDMARDHGLALEKKEREILQGLAAGYAKDLRDRRIEAYKELWAKLGILALYAPKQDVRYHELEEITGHLSAWYYAVGGLLLSTEARDAYFALQDALTETLRAATLCKKTEDVLRSKSEHFTLREIHELEKQLNEWVPGTDPKLDFIELRRRMSTLRSRLCDDAGTRDPAMVRAGIGSASSPASPPSSAEPGT